MNHLLMCIIFCLIWCTTLTGTYASTNIESLKATSQAFYTVAQRAKPAVVSISTVRTVQSYSRSPFMNDPFFNYFYGDPYGEQTREGLGSGVMVTKYGHILTNHHVIERASKITVTLSDGTEYTASVIGSDKKTDLAVLKIDNTAKPFTYIDLGNSDDLYVGEWAIAIGNPFGLAGTVTVGIISATGRSGVIDVENYADFIQTDAAINPGNSGGALLNIDGQLIGINTAIFSQNGGYMGIGFAIPVNMAKRVMEDIIAYGKVKRGMLGVTISPVTDDIFKRYKLSTRLGAFIVDVNKGSAADKAGIRPGDLIIELGGKKVTDYLALRTRISELKLAEKSYCIVLRDGKKKRLEFILTDDYYTKQPTTDILGLQLAELNSQFRQDFSIPQSIDGLVITAVTAGSLASNYRLNVGQVITKINNTPVKSFAHYSQLIKQRNVLLLTIYEQGFEFSIIVRK